MTELPTSAFINDLQQYRRVADKAFSRRLATPKSCRRYFFDLLIAATTVYQDFLLTMAVLPGLYRQSDRKAESQQFTSSNSREAAYRQRYTTALHTIPFVDFTPSGLAKLSFGWEREDYTQALGLHVPEIYEETFRLELRLGRLAAGLTRRDLTHLEVEFCHLAENHCTFLLPVLQDLAVARNWKDLE